MNRFKQLLRRLLLIVLIILASVGIGLSGGIPIPTVSKRREKSEINNEHVDKEEKTEKASAELRG